MRGRRKLIVPFEVPPGSIARATVHQSVPTATQHRSEPVEIPPGAELVGGIGLHALGVPHDVRFRIVASTAGLPRRTVLDERVARAGARWRDYRIDLGAFAGRVVTFTFSTVPVGAGEQGPALPLWSRPTITVPVVDASAANVILISLDTLRGDYVGASGRGRVDTPALDGLAAAGAYFMDAMAPYPSTTASHMSLFTGLYPSVHEIRAPEKVLPHEIRTLTETLADHGWATAAVTEDGMLLARSGFQRGFDSYRELKEPLPTMTSGHVKQVTAMGLAWIDAHRDERFFVFLHTYQVHAPYAPPPEFHRHRDSDHGDLPAVERDRRAYADEVEYTDHVVGDFFRALDERGLRERTIVIVVADHGEAFGEDGLVLHGSWVHEPQIHVPLIVRFPGHVRQGVRSDVPVSLIDVAPTILDLVGIDPTPHVQGRSLVALLEGHDDTLLRERTIFAEVGSDQKLSLAVRRADTKWIIDAKGPVRAFDLRSDPSESSARTGAAEVEQASRLAATFRANAVRLRELLLHDTAAPTAPPIDADAEERLRALGYVE